MSALKAWNTTDFAKVFKREVQDIDHSILPLQAGLSQSSHVADSEINVIVLNAQALDDVIRVKASIFYAGIIAGSCCADDPTPVDEQTEYCELQFDINKKTAETTVTLLTD